jgi:hypothetical protein
MAMDDIREIAERNCERDDEAYLAWTCAVCIGMLFPAQFEAIWSRFYVGMTLKEQANWMSCSMRGMRALNRRALRNMKTVAKLITRAMESKE